MGLFKALFAGIANFFKILVDGIVGAFSGPTVDVLEKDASSTAAPSPQGEPSFRASSNAPAEKSTPAPVTPVAAASTESPADTPSASEADVLTEAAAEPVAATTDGPIAIKEMSQPTGAVQFASLNELKAIERPKRRPGASLSPFKAMVRDMQKSGA